MKKLLLVAVAAMVISCGSNNEAGNSDSVNDAAGMLESVFEGPYSKWAIRDSLGKAFAIYKVDANAEIYLKTGNKLVELRKENNGSFNEMDIISKMIESNGAGGIAFDEQLKMTVDELRKEIADRQ